MSAATPPPPRAQAAACVAAVAPSHNSGDYLLRCVRSLLASTTPVASVCVVDSASTDDAVDRLLREATRPIDAIRLKRDKGISYALNVGIRRSLQRKEITHLLLLDDDVWLEPDVLGALLETSAALPQAAIISPTQCLYESDEIDEGHRRALTTRQRTIHLPGPGGTVREVVSVMDVVGATMLLPRKAIERIGLFDENFFLYGNDTELCYRARHHGYEVIVAPDVKVHHRHAGQCAMEPWSRRAIFSQRAMMIRSVKIRNRSLAYGISDCLRSLWNDMRDAINRRSARALRAQLRNALWLCRKLPSIINSRFRDYPLHRTKERTA